MEENFKLIKTNISKAYWCIYNTHKDKTEFEPAASKEHGIKVDDKFYENKESKIARNYGVSWFDNLFKEGGIKVSEGKGRPMTLLITGPPGSGKTTLALELCIRVAMFHDLWSIYISTESETNLLIEKIKSFGIPNSEERIQVYQEEIKDKEDPTPGIVTIYGQEHVEKRQDFFDITSAAIDDVFKWISGTSSSLADLLFRRARHKIPSVGPTSPPIIIFDSLNMANDPEDKKELFDKIITKTKDDTKLIILIMDSNRRDVVHENWEFACDSIIRLDYDLIKLDSTSMRDYYVRYIEVIKARYQEHVWGKQQMKIYGIHDLPGDKDPNFDSKMRRAHPYREEGGIFIYPSIHSFLSKYKRIGSTEGIKSISTPCKGLNKLIDGFPKGRCTAFMGVRGGHKSHLAYLHILEQVIPAHFAGKSDKNGLIISLRDDELMTKQHLAKILRELFLTKNYPIPEYSPESNSLEELFQNALNLIEELQKKDLIEILYFPPGYITPDEFFHRVFMSIFRFKYAGLLRKGKRNKRNLKKEITVMFNSLDQLAARFPLCAHQPIFIPALIHCLTGEDATSIFIGVDEPGQPPTQYGLLPMADLILNFNRFKIREEDYYAHHRKLDEYSANEKGSPFREEVILEISRFAGGRRAGVKGLLELVYSDSKNRDPNCLINEPGLHFNEWDYEIFDEKKPSFGKLN